jgi:hypothetical protein
VPPLPDESADSKARHRTGQLRPSFESAVPPLPDELADSKAWQRFVTESLPEGPACRCLFLADHG